ncbi:Ribosomal protein L35 [Arabidopsis thaliana x Arabidopsis arenosa]|uniref:Large ribosomal subunit protein bL35c n=1 Tax=Arabidopsis thaliana x Arabidopsis arenosa TaxID=1240361 RepID=A0A8T2A6D5_9BRAS|nr:Ribosomal protein L35 [Arabidopsis thaliana x Arabidopsis arenosa]
MASLSMASVTVSFCHHPLRSSSPKFSLRSSVNFATSLASSHSISGLRAVFPQKISTVASPNSQKFQSFTVFAHKGYKLKTHKASAKRFRVTGRGKIVRRRSGKQHLLAKKNNKRKLRLSKMTEVNRSDYDNVIGALPYLKVNRKAT